MIPNMPWSNMTLAEFGRNSHCQRIGRHTRRACPYLSSLAAPGAAVNAPAGRDWAAFSCGRRRAAGRGSGRVAGAGRRALWAGVPGPYHGTRASHHHRHRRRQRTDADGRTMGLQLWAREAGSTSDGQLSVTGRREAVVTAGDRPASGALRPGSGNPPLEVDYRRVGTGAAAINDAEH